MTPGVALTESEDAVILAYSREGPSSRQIVTRTGHGWNTILHLIRRGKVRGGTRKRGIRRKLPMRVVRLILRRAKTGLYTSRELRDAFAPMVTVRRVQQLLAADPDLCWQQMPASPALTADHRRARLQWARQKAVIGGRWWRRVVFSDESRFSLDGPDRLSAHWHNARRLRRWQRARRCGGGSVMVWAWFSWEGKPELVFIEGNMDSSCYCATLGTILLPFIENHHPKRGFIPARQCVLPHFCLHEGLVCGHERGCARLAGTFTGPESYKESMGILGRAVYSKGRQFDSVDDLKEALVFAWDNIDRNLLRNLVTSMPVCVFSLI